MLGDGIVCEGEAICCFTTTGDKGFWSDTGDIVCLEWGDVTASSDAFWNIRHDFLSL